MLDISWGGLLGAILGTIVSGLVYGTLIDAIERFLMARQKSGQESGQEQAHPPMSRSEIALMRRGVLSANMLLFAGLGYFVGHWINSLI